MAQIFENIYHYIRKQKPIGIGLLLLILGGSFLIASKINLEEDITKIIPKGEKTDITAKVMQQLNFADKIAVMVSITDNEKRELLADVAQEFLDTLSFHDQYYTQIQGKVQVDQMEEIFDFVYDHLPLFFDSNDYEILATKLHHDSIKKRLEQNYNTLISPAGMIAKTFVIKDPLGLSFVGLEKLRSVGVSEDFEIENGFITSANGKTILLFITPLYAGTDTKNNESFVDILYGIQDFLNAEHKNKVAISYFGSPFIALANAQQIKSDIQKTVAISLTVLMLILILFYRNIFVPLILFIPVICGALVAGACMFFLKDSVSAISLSIGAVLLGITLDYPIHIITHYRSGVDIKTLYKHITKPILSSSLTTSTAFLCLLFVNSEVLQDLGVFAAISVLVSAISALIITPHLYKPRPSTKSHILDKLASYQADKNNVLLALSICLLILGFTFYNKVSFNSNLADLNFVPENMIQAEAQLENLGSIGAKSVYVVSYGDNLNDVLDNNQSLEKKLNTLKAAGIVSDYTSMGCFILSEQKQLEKIAQWNQFWTANNLAKIATDVQNRANELGFKKDLYATFEDQISASSTTISHQELMDFQALPVGDFLTEKNGFYTLSTLVKIDEENRQQLYAALENENIVLVDRKHLNEQFLGQLKDDFLKLMNLSFLAIFVIMLFFFKRIELALLAMVPIVCTGLITAGTMALLGIELNVFSTIVTTLILGLGIDFSIFMTSGLQLRFTTGKNELSIYRTSILLAVITTLLALGALIFAKHPALTSISWASIIGVLSALFMTFVLYPRLFYWLIEKPKKRGKAPTGLREFLTALLSFAVYGIGGIFYSIFGMVYMKLMPIPLEKKKKWYRRVIAKFIKSIMFTNPWVKKKVLNLYDEKFEKPAIIIANHTSFLDTLSMGFIPTSIIFVVNDWVYNSPIFGKAVQLAGYVPASDGMENGESKLIEYVKQGYSLVIFPEGTRSANKVIGRFHKGAFYLAKHYNIDVVPVFLHGNGDLNPKGTFVIRDGSQTIVIGKRISAKDFVDKETKVITREISARYKADYRMLRHQLEDENYYQKRVRKSFMYKTNEVVNMAKKEFTNHKKWLQEFNLHISHDAKIQRFGNDFGIVDVMLCLQEPSRKVNTDMRDEENRCIAEQNHLLQNHKITYSKNSLQDLDVLIVNTKFAQSQWEGFCSIDSLQYLIIDQELEQDVNLDGFEHIKQIDGMCLYKRNGHGKEI